MRRLTEASAALLAERWHEDREVQLRLRDLPETQNRTLFGDAESNRDVEEAAVKAVTAVLRSEGWKVVSVERDRAESTIGYDLLCSRGDEELHAEVKGTRSSKIAFILTEGELRRAETDEAFALFVVTCALESPKLRRFAGEEFLDLFDVQPLAHRATLRSHEPV